MIERRIGHQALYEELVASRQKPTFVQPALLVGKKGVGKARLAEAVALRLVGAEQDAQESLDILWVRREEGKEARKTIGAETLREALRGVTQSARGLRVVIIDEAERLTVAAQNVLLKSLEEPQEHIRFFLTAEDKANFLPTLLSRVEVYEVGPVGQEVMQEHFSDVWLAEAGIPGFFRDLGRPGILEEAQQNGEEFLHKKECLAKLFRLHQLSAQEKLAVAEKIATDRDQAVEILEWYLTWFSSRKPGSSREALAYARRVQKVLVALEELRQPSANTRLSIETMIL